MNKTITINLAGINFYIDEVAFYKLDSYLKSISDSLQPESREETMLDIESRIAELLFERGKKGQEVINLNDVDYLISILGQPEAFQMDDEETYNANFSHQNGKNLYRDMDQATVAGVCSGLAHYFGISTLWMRIIFIVLFLASASTFALVYILLWALVPPALTTAEKLSMQGKKINIDNIEKEVREGFNRFRDNVENADYSGVKNVGTSIGNFFIGIGKFIAKTVGALLVLIAGIVLIALLLSFLGLGTFTIADTSWLDYVQAADIGVPFSIAVVLIFLFLGIPLFYLLILGLRILITKMNSLGKPTNFILWGIWILSFVGITILGIRQAPIRAYQSKTTEQYPMVLDSISTIKITHLDKINYPNLENYLYYYLIRSDDMGNKAIVSDRVDLKIESTNGQAYLEITKFAKGKNINAAKNTAEKIIYNFENDSTHIKLQKQLYTDITNKFQNQKVRMTLYMPENQYFRIDQSIFRMTSGIPYKYHEGILYFKDGKIQCLECEDSK